MANGWTEERRSAAKPDDPQLEALGTINGTRTEVGKARSARNAYSAEAHGGGFRS